MFRRVLASLLWVWCIATAWSFLAWATGAPGELGLFVGLAVGAFVGMDPLHRIWTTTHPVERDAPTPRLEPDAV
jgi:hypothetical protein